MVLSLANQLISCFDKQTEAIKSGLEALSVSLLQNVPKLVAEEFEKALAKRNAGPQTVNEVPQVPLPTRSEQNDKENDAYVASGTVESLFLFEDDDDDDMLFFEKNFDRDDEQLMHLD